MLARITIALSFACASQAPWTSDPAFTALRARDAIPRAPRAFPGGDEYELRGTVLHRKRAGVSESIGCTDPAGTGELRAITSRPAGTIWVAAARGLFCLAPEVELLDEVRRIDGAPRGPPVGVVFGDADRLWLATEEEFGVIDPRQGFGRRLSDADGLPPGPYRALLPARDGGLILRTDLGLFHYRPELGAKPELRLRTVLGRSFDPSRRQELGSDGSVDLELEGSGLGGASFRYRLLGHHLWKELDAPKARIEGLEPGDQTLELIALDRDLRRSDPVRVDVRVPVPWYFRTRLLLAGAAVLLVSLLAGALFTSWRSGADRRATGRALLGALLAFLVGLQVLGGLVPHARSWPIVGFAMYTDVYRAGGYTYQLQCYGSTQDGRRVLIRPWGSGYGQFEWHRDLADVVFGGEERQSAWLGRWNERFGPGRPFAGFLVQDERHRLLSTGATRVAPVVFAVHPREL